MTGLTGGSSTAPADGRGAGVVGGEAVTRPCRGFAGAGPMTGTEVFALSPQQRRAWQLRDGDRLAGLAVRLELTGEIDAGRLAAALRSTVARHEILRTRIEIRPGFDLPGQIVDPPETAAEPICLADRVALDRWLAEPAGQFQLAFTAGAGGGAVAAWLPATHGDRATAGRLLGMIADAYVGGATEPVELQYADVAAWLDELTADPAGEAARAAWRQATGAEVLAARLPFGTARPASRPEYREVAAEVRRPGTTDEEAVLLAGWRASLRRLTGQDDIAVGVRSAGREAAGLGAVLGPLDRVVATAIRPGAADPVEAEAEALRLARSGELYHSWDESGPGWPAGTLPQLPYAFEYVSWPEPVTVAGVRFELASCTGETDRFAVLLRAVRAGEGLRCAVVGDATSVPAAFLPDLLRQFVAALTNPDTQLDAAMAAEAVALGYGAAAPLDAIEYPHETMFRQFAAVPERTAVITDATRLSYADVGARATGLAGRLRDAGAGPERPVAVLLDRCADAVIAIAAVFAAGGVYAPIDPNNPAARIQAILRQLRPVALVTDDPRALGLAGDIPLIDPRDAAAAQVVAQPWPIDPLGAAVVIHTSGSTGVPKAVVLTHRGLLNRFECDRRRTPIEPADRFLWTTGIGFDYSILALLAPLAAGAAIVVPDADRVAVPAHIVSMIREHRVTITHFTPSKLAATLATEDLSTCDTLRRVQVSGEAIRIETLDRMHAVSRAEVHNWYAPTECHVDVTHLRTVPGQNPVIVPLGRPVENVSVHVLDAELRPVPTGVRGELCIGGLAPARGYLDMPGETARRFVPDPYGVPGGRLYRSGDLGRRRWDGVLEHLGRMDDQVGIRGFRIELQEVEAALLRCAGVHAASATVLRPENVGAMLIAFVVADPVRQDAAAVTAALAGLLPHYMVPSQVRFLDALPLNRSGKVDRAALAVLASGSSPQAYVAPDGDLERAFAVLWRELISAECGDIGPVGRDADFYQLGGHSLVTLGVLSFAHRVLGVELLLRDLLTVTTVAELAAAVTAREPVPGQAARGAGIWLTVMHDAG